MAFLSFSQARTLVKELGFRNVKEWREYARSSNKRADIPTNPNTVYKNEWKSWGDWLGTDRDRQYMEFEQARQFIHSLRLKSQAEWKKYCKSGNKPAHIPAYPEDVSKYTDKWKGIGDWLGTGRVAEKNRVFRPFEEARDFVHKLRLKTGNEWLDYCKSGNKPYDIAASPEVVYENQWRGMGDWLGTGRIADKDKVYRPFEEVRSFVRSLKLKSVGEWKDYCKSGNKHSDVPSNPNVTYKNNWKGMGDWLGTGTIATLDREYRPFEDARSFVHKLGLKKGDEWSDYCKSGNKPADIPAIPAQTYKNQWRGIGDWLGTGRIADKDKVFRPFEEAREFVHSLKLKSNMEWRDYSKSANRPANIPTSPESVYKNSWKGYGDWLGTGRIADQYKEYKSFDEARIFVRLLKLEGVTEWYDYCKSGNKPADIPSAPDNTYKEEWKGMGDWLGTGTLATKDRVYRSYEEAKGFVHSLELESPMEWRNYLTTGKKPSDIPSAPDRIYTEWLGWGDWLGYEGKLVPIKVKELLRDLIKSRIIYEWDEAVLYSFLNRRGLLNLYAANRHSEFFKNLIEASRTDQGRRAIEEYVYSKSKVPPDLSKFTSLSHEEKEKIRDPEQEIQAVSSHELAGLVEQEDPLDYGKIPTVKQIFAHTNILESTNVDEEAMQFYIHYSINELWKSAFRDPENTIQSVKNEGKNGNKYHDLVLETFLSDYKGTQSTKIPDGYAFPYPPTLMQMYVAYKVKTNAYFGNFSGTGAGKTLSAVLASRVIASKMTVIVCPNDVVQQWKKNILEIFPNSNVITGKEAFFVTYDENNYQYLVLNYDKFSQDDSSNLILNLVKQKVDFVVLDEVHFVKKRDEESSQRRRNLDGLMTAVRRKSNKIRALGLSATPVINNLTEGRSLLELITAKIYDDVAIRPTIPNAVTLYEKLSIISIRELPQYSIDLHTEHVDVQAERPQTVSIKHLKSNPLAIEQFLTNARIPKMIKLIEDQTIIYTEYVTGVIEKLSRSVEEAGYSYALYTGYDRSGLKKFLDKRVQVLIASRPISVGIDGIQHICNRLIINTLPWTNAQYQQLLGRLVRKGQIRDIVHVYIVKASISGYSYDQLKWNRIQFKRTLADCAVDGRLPEKNLVTPQQAAMEAVKWLERLERGEISTVSRRDLNVELTPIEIKQRIRKYGDFTRLNNRINIENSDSTHRRLLNEPREWEEYHRQYREARKTWSIIPYEEIINRIKELSTRLQIGDFGCGEAKIAEVISKERVYSFDHVAINDNITACDMKSVPLPNDSLDVAVFSLSLMGKNWPGYISEAKRCLATNGYLLIAETTKSLSASGRLSGLRDVIKENGFEIYNDEQRGDFTFIEAREL